MPAGQRCPEGHDNPVDARFCTRCGRSLPAVDPWGAPAPAPAPAPADAWGSPPDPTPPALPPEAPTALLGPPPGPAAAPPPPPPEPRTLRWALIVAAIAVVVVGIAFGVVALVHHRSGSPTASSPTTSGLRPGTTTPISAATTATTVPGSTTTAPAGSTGGAAAQIASEVTQSAQVRPGVSAAITQVASCAISASAGEQQLQQAISTRSTVLAALARINPSDLSNGTQIVADLTQALQASSKADQSYLAWMQDGPTCHASPSSDSNYQAGDAASAEADQAKAAFVGLWNPIAPTYGQRTFQATDF